MVTSMKSTCQKIILPVAVLGFERTDNQEFVSDLVQTANLKTDRYGQLLSVNCSEADHIVLEVAQGEFQLLMYHWEPVVLVKGEIMGAELLNDDSAATAVEGGVHQLYFLQTDEGVRFSAYTEPEHFPAAYAIARDFYNLYSHAGAAILN